MQKITIKKALEFDKKTKRAKVSMINRLKQPVSIKTEGGGDYWVRSLTTITNACKDNDHQIIIQKIMQIIEDRKTAERNQTKNMYDRNIQIMENFESFDFNILKPHGNIKYLGGLRLNSIITTQGLPLQIVPSVVFTFDEKNISKIGAILFIAKLEKYSDPELAIICEALYRNLRANYGNDYQIDREFCSVVDVLNITILKHSDINNSLVSRKLNTILREIRELL